MTKEELIENNIGLARACSKKFIRRGIEYEELYSAALLGLVKAADRFDESKGFRFSTYAVPVILGEVKRLFRDFGSVKISRSLKELSMKAKELRENSLKDTGEEPRLSELSEKLGVDTYTASLALNASYPVLSLSAFYDSEESETDIPTESEEEGLTERLSLEQAMEELSESERELIRLRYFQHMTQTAAADKLSMTQVQVSRKEKKILTKLRAMLV